VPNQPIYNCFEKDLEPVDTDEEFLDYCKDYAGNVHYEYSNVTSCCECISYECVPLGEFNEQKYYYWNKSISEHCCLHCDGTVYKADTVIESVFDKDECGTVKTSICRKNDKGVANIEIDFTYTYCCNDEEGILPINTTKLEPSTCSERTCEYSPSFQHSSWISTQVLSGCNCCVIDGILVPNGFSWNIEDEEFECCEGKIVSVYEGSGSSYEILAIEDAFTSDCYTENLDCRSANNMLNWTIIPIRNIIDPIQEFSECKAFCDKIDGCQNWTLTAWRFSVNFLKCYALSSCSNIQNNSVLASGPRICELSVDEETKIYFQVKGQHNAHVLLSEEGCNNCECPDCNGYEIVIGGWTNTQSVIRDAKATPYPGYAVTSTPGILSPEEYREFYISLRMEVTGAQKKINVGVGKRGENPFMSYSLDYTHPINYIGFASWHKITNEYIFKSEKFSVAGYNYFFIEDNLV